MTLPPPPPVYVAPKGRRGRNILLVVVAVLVVAGIAAGAYALGVRHGSNGETVGTLVTKESTTTSTNQVQQSDDIPIVASTASASGIEPSTCQLNADGNSVIALGTFNQDISTNTNSSYENPYTILLGVYDSENAEIGDGSISFGGAQVADGNWQVPATINQGFTAARCVVQLNVQINPNSGGSGSTGTTGNTP